MKKIFLVVLVLLCSSFVSAGILDNLTICTLYDSPSQDLLTGAYTDVLSYQDLIALNIGLATSIQTSPLFYGLNLNIQTLSKKIGLKYHLAEPMKVGGFYSRNFQEQTNMYGIFFGFTWGDKE